MTDASTARRSTLRRALGLAEAAVSLGAFAAGVAWVAAEVGIRPLRDRFDVRRRAQTSAQINDLLVRANLRIVFQPIISTETGCLVGAEALSRFEAFNPADPPDPPDAVFARAAEVGLGVELELLAVRVALLAAEALPGDLYISVNVSPAAVLAPELTDALLASRVPLRRVVLEITEHVSVADYKTLTTRIEELRALGVRLAVDDAGAGFASFRHILRLSPEYIKLDRTLIENISEDPARRALAAAVVLFALEMGSAVVAEGVETLAELRMTQTLGIDSAQGFLLGRPTDDWGTWAEWHSNGPLYRLRAVSSTA
jgi:EAL domain-containing protein (putative c-di-GMP-specific phosphodiesterase class I)